MTIQQANQYFAALPDGFADPAQLGALLPASVQQVQFVGVAGTAGKTAVARLLAAILHAQGIRAGVYHAGCEPLAARIRVDGKPVDEALLCRAADALAAHEELPLQAAELVAAAYCFGEAGCTLAVVELPDAGLAAVLPKMPVCAVTAVGPDGVSRSVERLAALAGGVMRQERIWGTRPRPPAPARPLRRLVRVGEGAYTAAGSTITDEVPADSLAIARTRQTVKKQWAAKRRNRRK